MLVALAGGGWDCLAIHGHVKARMRNLLSLGIASAILFSLGCAGSHPFGLGWDELSPLKPIPSIVPNRDTPDPGREAGG